MMTKLREKTAVILWIVIFAFIGLIVVEWGADYSGTSQTSAGNTVGVVNGRKISHQEFRDRLSFAAQQQRQQPRGDADQEGRLVRETWDSFVSNILVNQEIERLGIEVTDREAVIAAHRRAEASGWTIHKPARTTWRGTPLHELWLKDPGDNLIEIYARLTDAELAQMPVDKEPWFLVEAP